MIAGHALEAGDIDALAQILENERIGHCRKRALCLGMFVFFFVVLVVAIGAVVYMLVNRDSGLRLELVQALGVLAALVVGLFSMWWTVQNCINSIERTLFAARAGRNQLFASFLGQLQCADKNKKQLWLEVISAAVT